MKAAAPKAMRAMKKAAMKRRAMKAAAPKAACHEDCGTSSTKGHAGDEEGSHEACHEGCSTKGHAGDEEGSHEACHEGCGTKGHEGHEEVNIVPRFSRRHQRP